MFDTHEVEARVRTSLEGFPDDPSSVSSEQLEQGFGGLQRLSQVVEAKRLRWLAEVERRASFRKDGYVSGGAWLADRFGLPVGAAKHEVRVAQALEEMPEVRSSFSRGEVSSSAVRVLVAARADHPEAFSGQEGALVEQAQTKSVEELRRVIEEWAQAVDEEGADRRAARLRERRRFDVCPTAWGMVRMEGELDPESGEHVMTALQAIVDAELRCGLGSDLRSPAQRRADALTELACRYLDSPERPVVAGERPHVTVTVDVETLRGRTGVSEFDHSGPVHPESARRLACDASLMRVVMAGNAEPLSLGRRTAVVPASLRRAVVVRDKGCRFPGCNRPHAWTDAHHVRHWAQGGETALSNLILLCRPHHRLVHEGGFGLHMANDKPVFRRPDGSVIQEHRAPP